MMVQTTLTTGKRQDARPIEWDDATLEDAIAGKFKVTRFGQPIHFKLSPAGRKEYETAKRQGYIVRSRGGNNAVENVYWHDDEPRVCYALLERIPLADAAQTLAMLSHVLAEASA